MENKKEKLVLDGNAFYELDLECLKHRKENMQKETDKGRGNDPLLFVCRL